MKLPKQAVNYRPARSRTKRCATCSMFRYGQGPLDDTCTLVAGVIRAADTCDRWESKSDTRGRS